MIQVLQHMMSRDNGNIECVSCIKIPELLRWLALYVLSIAFIPFHSIRSTHFIHSIVAEVIDKTYKASNPYLDHLRSQSSGILRQLISLNAVVRNAVSFWYQEFITDWTFLALLDILTTLALHSIKGYNTPHNIFPINFNMVLVCFTKMTMNIILIPY